MASICLGLNVLGWPYLQQVRVPVSIPHGVDKLSWLYYINQKKIMFLPFVDQNRVQKF